MGQHSGIQHQRRLTGDEYGKNGVTVRKAMSSGFHCAGCGEWNETSVDNTAGRSQTYVEDCQVCCRPNVLRLEWDQQAQDYMIHSELE